MTNAVTSSKAYRAAFEKYLRRQPLTDVEQQLFEQCRLPEPFTEAELRQLEELASVLNDEGDV